MTIDFNKVMLTYYPDPILKTKCHDIDPNDPNLSTVLDKMVAIMFANEGLGLAAPQVGLPWNVFIVSLGPNAEPRALINPRIESVGENKCHSQEGCLSLPGVVAHIHERYETIDISTCRPSNDDTQPNQAEERTQLTIYGAEAIIFQHEMDHLQGKTILDRMSQLTRSMAKKKYLKQRKKYSKLMKNNQTLTLQKGQLEELIKQMETNRTDSSEPSSCQKEANKDVEQNTELADSSNSGDLGDGGCADGTTIGTAENDR